MGGGQSSGTPRGQQPAQAPPPQRAPPPPAPVPEPVQRRPVGEAQSAAAQVPPKPPAVRVPAPALPAAPVAVRSQSPPQAPAPAPAPKPAPAPAPAASSQAAAPRPVAAGSSAGGGAAGARGLVSAGGQRAPTQPGILGIDFGNGSCRAAYWDHAAGQPYVVRDIHRTPNLVSSVAFIGEERFLGEEAVAHTALFPYGTIFDLKRMIGRRITDPVIQSIQKKSTFKITTLDNMVPVVAIPQANSVNHFTPVELSAMLIMRLRDMAQEAYGGPMRTTVLTVPVAFNTIQRQALRDAAALAGLGTVRLVEEPVAAAVAYLFDWLSFDGCGSGWSEMPTPQRLHGADKVVMTSLVFDMGAAHCNVSVQTFEQDTLTVHAMAGDLALGGDDFTARLAGHLRAEYRKQHGIELSMSQHVATRLRAAAERAKLALTTHDNVAIDVPQIVQGSDLKVTLTRSGFIELTQDLFRRCVALISKCLTEAKLTKESVHDVVLVGGATRMPLLEELVREFFESKVRSRVLHFDEGVALGAAIIGAMASSEAKSAMGGGGGKRVSTAPPKWSIREVTNVSYGIALTNGEVVKVLPSNASLPVASSVLLSTAADNQTSVLVQCLEGDRPRSDENTPLGRIELASIPSVPKGVPLLDVALELNAARHLTIRVSERHTRASKEMTIDQNEVHFTKADVGRFQAECERFQSRYLQFVSGSSVFADATSQLLAAVRRAALHVPKGAADLTAEAKLLLGRVRAFIAAQLEAQRGAPFEPSRFWRAVSQVCAHVELLYLDPVPPQLPDAKFRAHLCVKLDEIRALVPLTQKAVLSYWDEVPQPLLAALGAAGGAEGGAGVPGEDATGAAPPASDWPGAQRPVPAGRAGRPNSGEARRRQEMGHPLVFVDELHVEEFCARLMDLNAEQELRLARVNQAQLYFHKNGTFFGIQYFERGVERLNSILIVMQMLAQGPNRGFLGGSRAKAIFAALLDKVQEHYFDATAQEVPQLAERRADVLRTLDKAKRMFDDGAAASDAGPGPAGAPAGALAPGPPPPPPSRRPPARARSTASR
eukprot:tig00000492_g1469.t1